jgi:hypothetical protein
MLVRPTAVRLDAQQRDSVLDFPLACAERPARPVLVRPSELWPPLRFRWAVSTPLYTKSQGIQLRDPVPGLVRGWVHAPGAGRLAHVEWTVHVQGVPFPLSSLIPVTALRPVTPEQGAGPTDAGALPRR